MYNSDYRYLNNNVCYDAPIPSDVVTWASQHWSYCVGTCTDLGFTKKIKDGVIAELGDMYEWEGTQWAKPTLADILDLFTQ